MTNHRTDFPKVSVGDKLICRYPSSRYRSTPNTEVMVIVTKVGRKYFTVEASDGPCWRFNKVQFYLDSGYEKGDTPFAMRLGTEESFRLADERRELLAQLRHYNIELWRIESKLSTDALRRILAIITDEIDQ